MSVGSKISTYHETTFMTYGYSNANNTNIDLQEKFLNYFKSSLPPKEFHDQMISHSKYKPYLSPPLSVASSPPTLKRTTTRTSPWNSTWLVFMNEKWVPFDMVNQTKLEQTLTVGGTFVDITDTHFPAVKRVRVFPRNNYLSYLGVKYRLSRIMQPDAYLDHMSVAEAKKPLEKNHYH